jgi:hypothetical protein
MKLSKLVLAAAIAMPAFAGAQGASPQAKPDMKVTFAVMKANVAKISDAGEKERWLANKNAWDVAVSQTGKVQAADLAKVSTALGAMKTNVAKITEATEKERWQANVDLWQLFDSRGGSLSKADLPAANASLEKIKANVARITAAAEKERWQADRDLWQIVIDRVPAK